MSAATPTAATPSKKSFARSIRNIMASATSSSPTVTMSSTQASTKGRVIRPGRLTAMPSARVVIAPPATGWLAYGAQLSTCTPTTVMDGSARFSAMATPLARPPPPIGMTTRRRSSTSSTSSSPSVAWPAMMARSS